jgi:hypothetical protein
MKQNCALLQRRWLVEGTHAHGSRPGKGCDFQALWRCAHFVAEQVSCAEPTTKQPPPHAVIASQFGPLGKAGASAQTV